MKSRRSDPGSGIISVLLLASILLHGCGGSTPVQTPAPTSSPAPSSAAGESPDALRLPPEATRWVNEGVAAYRQGRYHDAATAFAHARDEVPADPKVSNFLGTALLQAKQYTPAQAEFRRLLALQPEAIEPRLGLARIAIRVGDYEQAAGLFREVLDREPANPQALYNLGFIRYRAGNYPEARDLLQRMLMVRPDHPETHYVLGLVFTRLGDDPKAEQEFLRTIQLAPENSQAHFNLAKVYAREGRPAEAEKEQELFKRLWDRQAADRAAEGRARELFLAGNYPEALKEYDRLLQITPQSGRFQLGRGQCFLKMGRQDDALAALESAVSRDDKLADAYYLLAVLYQGRGEGEKSERARRAFDALEAIGENKTGF